jgi:putative flippase GtrA
MEKPVLLIPVQQNMDQYLDLLISTIDSFPDFQIIIVNDGCEIIDTTPFEKNNVVMLLHAVSLGKGQAIRSGINHYLIHYKQQTSGLIVVNRLDDDHLSENIHRIANVFENQPKNMIWGYVESYKPESSFIQFSTRLFGSMSGTKISQLEPAICAIPYVMVNYILFSKESGNDVFLDILSIAGKNDVHIVEICIGKSKSQDVNKNILTESVKLIFVFLRFSLISILTAAIDMAVFSLFYFFSNNILLSIILARIVAGTFQFVSGKHLVFRSTRNYKVELIKYISLVGILMMISYGVLTPMVIYLKFNPYIAKVLTEAIIFFLSFSAQRIFVFSKDEQDQSTDWDQYYYQPMKTTSISRRITQRILVNLMKKYSPQKMTSFCEFGGGNSSFFLAVRKAFPNALYTVVDNNQLGLDLFLKNNHEDALIRGVKGDVLNLSKVVENASIVYSVGLIEHFSPEDTEKAIIEHFKICETNGIVIITFPTPTWLYCYARTIAAFLGLWHFPDERPILIDEITPILKQFGEIKESFINWPILFTQGVVVVKKTK